MTRAPGAETHDGICVRAQLGVNATWVSAKAYGETAEYNGGGASVGVALGYSLTPHLIGYIGAIAAGATDVEARLNGVAVGGPRYGTNVYGIGPGAASYFGPNLFAAATLLLAKTQVTDNDGNLLAESKAGVAFEALFGKEWWVSANWGLGLSGQLILGAYSGKDPDVTIGAPPSWRTKSLSFLFSATYN